MTLIGSSCIYIYSTIFRYNRKTKKFHNIKVHATVCLDDLPYPHCLLFYTHVPMRVLISAVSLSLFAFKGGGHLWNTFKPSWRIHIQTRVLFLSLSFFFRSADYILGHIVVWEPWLYGSFFFVFIWLICSLQCIIDWRFDDLIWRVRKFFRGNFAIWRSFECDCEISCFPDINCFDYWQ